MYDGRHDWRARVLREAVRTVETARRRACDLVVELLRGGRRRSSSAQRARAPPIVVPNGVDLRRFCGPRRAARADPAGAGHPRRREGPPVHGEQMGSRTARRSSSCGRSPGASGAAGRQRDPHPGGGERGRGSRSGSPGFTATGKVDAVEPYFAAADAALNPMWSGAGTNVKMGEFLALRLPHPHHAVRRAGLRPRDGRDGVPVRAGRPGGRAVRGAPPVRRGARPACGAWPPRPTPTTRTRSTWTRARGRAGGRARGRPA